MNIPKYKLSEVTKERFEEYSELDQHLYNFAFKEISKIDKNYLRTDKPFPYGEIIYNCGWDIMTEYDKKYPDNFEKIAQEQNDNKKHIMTRYLADCHYFLGKHAGYTDP